MAFSTLITEQDRAIYSKNWVWFFIWGISLVLLGVVAIGASTLATLVSVIFLGFIIFFAGLVVIIDTLTFWRNKWPGFPLHLIMGLIYAGVGLFLIARPVAGSISLTLLLGVFYICLGAFRLASTISMRLPYWGWSFLNAVITLFLGMLILSDWPASSLFIIGLFVGIDLVFTGWAYIMMALSVRSIK
ncbi:MAG: DUF308 domain-containing protein [Gammaproteobacteria bacterium]